MAKAREPAHSTSRTSNTATKISESNLVSHLLFVFFSHDKVKYSQIREADRSREADSDLNKTSRDGAKDDLLDILSILFDALRTRQFNESGWTWITSEFTASNFRARGFLQYYRGIRQENIVYSPRRAYKVRNIFASMSAIARAIFRSDPGEFPYISSIRELIRFEPERDDGHSQMAVLGRIEHELKRINAGSKPEGAISFDAENQPIIRTNRRDYFPSSQVFEENCKYVTGRFVLFRRLFSANSPGVDYIREYLTIEHRKPFGICFRWETMYTKTNRQAAFVGVGLFAEDAFWLLGHSAEPFKRLRVATSNMTSLRAVASDKVRLRFFSLLILSHRSIKGETEAAFNIALCRREFDGDPEDSKDYLSNRVAALSRVELLAFLDEEQIAILDKNNYLS